MLPVPTTGLPGEPASVMSMFIVDVSRANVSMPDVFRFRKSLFTASRFMVALDTAVSEMPPDPVVELLVSLNVLPDTLSVRVPVLFLASNRFSPPVVSPFTKLNVELVTDEVPVRFQSLTSPSPTLSPKPVMVQLAIVRFETFWPLMPTCAPPVLPLPFMFKFVNDTVDTLLILMPA